MDRLIEVALTTLWRTFSNTAELSSKSYRQVHISIKIHSRGRAVSQLGDQPTTACRSNQSQEEEVEMHSSSKRIPLITF